MYWFTGLLGILMAVAPYLFSFSDNTTALWASIGLGALLFLLSAVEAWQQGKAAWEYWTIGVVGLVAIAAPFVLGFNALNIAMWTFIVLGGLALLLAGYQVFTRGQLS
ncbi:MAG: SPW repeat protein [Caldilineaceae bacterium]|nr:SPW repeat protein [Caldilineaceae bacterium]